MVNDDIEVVIKEAKRMRFRDGNHKPFLNPISSLPASKKNLKLAIKERIQLLCAAYISLASFVADEDIDILSNPQSTKKDKIMLKKILREMDKNRKEIKSFKPFEKSE